MKTTALITGASGGIGMELAKVHAAAGGNLVLVARGKAKLEALKKEVTARYKVEVYIIEKDLSFPDAALEVYTETLQQGITVDYLINNAGFGDFGMFSGTDWHKEFKMINLNIIALTRLTKLYVKDMISRGSGKIMNLASLAAFQPGPQLAVYSATKAYVLSFSQALNNELHGKGVSVTALCPGPTESGFSDAACMGQSKLYKDKKIPDSAQVAEYGYKAMLKGKPVAVHGTMNKLLANSGRFAPRSLVVRISRKIMEQAK